MYRYIGRFIVFSIVVVTQLLSTRIQAQGITTSSFTNSFRQYADKAIQEKLFLHTDKDFYLAGEICWFRIYYVDGSSHKPAGVSKLAYTEIINEKGQSMLQGKISLAPGESNGSFYLPATLSTGHYTLRAYTNWMRNFDEGNFFEKKITILNTVKTPEPLPATDSIPVINADFFPEGGNLVDGIQSRVGVMVKNKGRSQDSYKGYIIDKNNDTVTSFAPLKYGIGSFYFKPEAGNNYKAIIAINDSLPVVQSLPAVYENGYVIRLADNNDKVRVTIYRKKMPGEGSQAYLVLAAHTRQVLDLAETVAVNDNDSTVIAIDKKRLGKGTTQFTLFADNGSPLCERIFYIKPAQDISLQVAGNNNVFEQRKKIELNIKAQYGNAVQQPLDLSASVFYSDALQDVDPSNIVDYMWLTSDLSGRIESPDYYFSNDPAVPEATDNLMLTHGWRRFKWNDVLKGNNSFIRYLPEINGQVVTGIVRNKNTGKPVANVYTYLSIPGHPFGFYVSESNAEGMVRFEVKNYYGNSQVIPQIESQGDSLSLEIIKPFAEKVNRMNYQPYIPEEEKKDLIMKRNIGMQAQNIYLADSLRNFEPPIITDTLPFFGRGEAVYKLDDYRRFPTMEEVLREYVSEVGVGARGGHLIFKIFNPAAHDFYDASSLVLLDGVPLVDINKIFQYNPLNVQKLEVIRSRYVLGSTTFNGIASFTTYDGTFDGFELDPKLVSIDYAGLQLHREFYSPVYETQEQIQSKIPDFRNTLLWAPHITTSADGKSMLQFYASDIPGKYMVVVQGMSANGDFVSATQSFEVK